MPKEALHPPVRRFSGLRFASPENDGLIYFNGSPTSMRLPSGSSKTKARRP
ncbi:hypothetical protein BTHI11S_02035 [Bosea thiooxidans]